MTDKKPILYLYKKQKYYYTSQNKCCECLNITNRTLRKYLNTGQYKNFDILNVALIPKQAKHKNIEIENTPEIVKNMIKFLEYYDSCSDKNNKKKIYYEFKKLYKNN